MTARRVWLVMIGLVLATVCYYLPWYTHDTAGFTTNAFDLAEWTSLHPAVRSSSPPMLTSFLLRDPRARWVWRGFALLLALRFFPPSDFFTSATADPNYRQMMLLTGLGFGFVFAAILLARAPARWLDGLLIVTLVCGALAGWWGLSRAGVLLDNFEIDVSTGPGIVGLSLVTAAVVLIVLWPYSVRFLHAKARQQAI
jgi:hypothetical protein